jgi:GT2 family glycosyltransferase
LFYARLKTIRLRRTDVVAVLLWARDQACYLDRGDRGRFRRWLGEGASEQEGEYSKMTWRWGEPVPEQEFVILHPSGTEPADTCIEILLHKACEEEADLVYPDEIVDGLPRFKPGFSIDLLCACDYIGDVALVRSSMLRKLAKLPEVRSVYELTLRLHAAGGRIAHASGWVEYPHDREQKLDAQKLALAQEYGPPYVSRLVDDRNTSVHSDPSVVNATLIIPTKDRLDLLEALVVEIYGTDNAATFEVLIVDNGSSQGATLRWLAQAPQQYPNLTVLRDDGEFNWSRLNNLARPHARGHIGVFMNNDLEGLEHGWLDLLLARASAPGVGAVGALLVYPDQTIQHAGVVVGIGNVADHIYSGVPAKTDDGHLFIDPFLPRNVLVCTGALLAIGFDRLDQVGGFDESLHLSGDVAMCVSLHRHGYRNLYDPAIRAIHHESATRPRDPLEAREIERLLTYIGPFLDNGDPFYNPLLTLRSRYPTYETM